MTNNTWFLLRSFMLVHAVVSATSPQHRGLYSDEVDQYELVFPRKVTAAGRLLSHDVTHHHRVRRDATEDAAVHYRLNVSGQVYHVQLWPSSRFMAPRLVVERWRNVTAISRAASNSSTGCHYQGSIRGQPGSQVALSACHGLAGLLRTNQGEFWVEPARGRDPQGKHPHVVFKRSAVTSGHKKRKRKKKKKHEKNCATREPRRLTETRLEWKAQSGRVQVQGRGKSRKARWRRSMSRERHVEALLVADTSMMKFHEDGDVETYILTIMNMVSSLYLDPSIGNPINIVVVRIILMEDDVSQKQLNISVNADDTLENFCTWQLTLNPPDDAHPNHHDVAILVTREDICARQNEPCSTLGVAHVAGMCEPDRSCNVNEDNGITLAHTITHELGHNFGMYHDTEKIGCSRRQGDTLHVMTPSFEADTVDVAWSPCSRRDITNFLDQGLGGCLEDEPSDQEYSYPDLPPGAMYNAEHQCRLQFGNRDTEVCSPLHEICSRLWCVVDGTCTTVLRPAAPGTHCGKHMWCLNQQCVTIGERPDPIHGGWGEWGSWSECSRTCGAGVATTHRHCDHPMPAFGGKFCVGERRRYKICHTEPCEEGSPSFRATQCSAYNNQELHGKTYEWLPYFDKTEPCELYCSDTEDSMIVPWGDSVLDGTPCNVGTRDMCIGGICKKVGCDWVVDSAAQEDRCGVCHGDGSQCQTLTGVYNRRLGSGYREVVIIPSGSRNIRVEELGNSRNYIGIGSAKSGKYFLNGKRQITLAGEYKVAGTPALYERDKELEKVRIPGPIKEDILIYLIYRGRYRNLGLRYEYTVPKRKPVRQPEFRWVFSDWSSCSATCGSGTQASHAVCHERDSGLVQDTLCDNDTQLDTLMRVCNTHPCPARWWVGPWQLCPVTCGDLATRRRTVMCVVMRVNSENGREMALPDAECKDQPRPAEQERCPDLRPCFTTDNPSTPVPSTSGYDQHLDSTSPDPNDLDEEELELFRSNFSLDGELPPLNILLNSITTSRSHNVLQFAGGSVNSSEEWVPGPWGPCSARCGSGIRTRQLECSGAYKACNSAMKPATSKHCYNNAHCRLNWITGDWGPCNVSCGSSTGFRQRVIACQDQRTGNLVHGCDITRRPEDRQTCQHHRAPCPKP